MADPGGPPARSRSAGPDGPPSGGAGPVPARRGPGRRPAGRGAAPAGRGRRAELWAFLELSALCGFVVVQPLLDVVGRSPDFFIFHGVGTGGILVLVGLVVLVPPVGLWAVGWLAGLAGRRARTWAHVASVALLAGLFLIELGKQLTTVRGAALAAVAAVAAAALTAGYLWSHTARQLLRFAAVGPVVFALLFAFASPASAVVFSSGDPGSGGQARAVGPHPAVVMIILDELSLVTLLDGDGRIDRERFPGFAALAGDSTWYRNATGAAGWTPYAVPSMLTGRWPAEHLAPHYAAYPDNLFSLFGEVYRVEAHESITQLCPPRHCGGDAAGTTRGGLPVALAETTNLLGEILSPRAAAGGSYDDFAEPTVRERRDELAQAGAETPQFRFQEAFAANQPARYQGFLAGLAAGGAQPSTGPGADAAAGDQAGGPGRGTDPGPGSGPDGAENPDPRPVLHFLHLLLPHTPWNYLPDGTRYRGVEGLPVDGPWWGRLAYQRHVAQLRYTDRLVGEAVGVLKRTGVYDDAVVVLTSDHGLRLTPSTGGQDRNAGDRQLGPRGTGAEELAWVPLLVKAPGQVRGRVDDRNWQHVDLLPTLAELAGLEVPWPVDGVSGLGTARTGSDKRFFSDLDDQRVLDGATLFPRILAAGAAYPPVPEAPLPELVGTEVDARPVVEGPSGAKLADPDRFRGVDPDSGEVPALVHGTVPGEVDDGTPLAIAVNGRIAGVVPVVAEPDGVRRFAGLVQDTGRFRPGDNRVELFLVPDGFTLRRLR